MLRNGWDVSIRTPRDKSPVEDSGHLQTRRSYKIIAYLIGKIVTQLQLKLFRHMPASAMT
jgi:hypothetical protein